MASAAQLAVSTDADASGSYSVVGDSWQRSMVFYQRGATVTGNYTFYGGTYPFTGTVSGYVLTGSFNRSGAQSFTATFNADSSSFAGSDPWGNFTGTKQSIAVIRSIPTQALVKVGGSLTIDGLVGGVTDKSITWSATGGTVANGVYTAPLTPGVYIVSASSSVQPTVKSTTTVQVTVDGSLDASGSYSVVGDSWQRSMVFYQRGATVTGNYTFYGGTYPFTGTVSGYVLTGSFNRSGAQSFTATFNADSSSFAGSDPWGNFTATKLSKISVLIQPTESIALKSGEAFSYFAAVAGSFNKQILWTASSGNITNGLYTAPASAGVYTISAVSKADVKATSQALVYVNTWKGAYASWSFNEGSDFLANDASGHGFTGTLLNGAGWAPGKIGQGLSLNGKSSYVSASIISPFNAPFTVSTWVKFSEVNRGVDNPILFHGTPATDQGLVLYERGGKAYFDFSYDALVSNATLPANQWVHLVFVYDGSSRKIYINGVLDVAQACNKYGGQGNSLTMGQWPWATENTLLGALDELQIFDRSFVDAEVVALYASQVTVAVLPRTATLAVGQSQTFTATLTGSANTAITWELPDANSGNITAQGVYTAPTTVPSSGATYRVNARSIADSSQIDTALVTVKPFVRITPESVTLVTNGSYPYRVEVTGLASNDVTWTATGGSFVGNIYNAPATGGTYTITATSVADSTKLATATVKVVGGNVPAANGLVGYWKLDWNTADSSGYGNHGILMNGATYNLGQTGYAAQFDGINSSIDIPSVNPFMGPFTVSAWVKFSAIDKGTDNAILGHGTSGTNLGLHLGERNGKAYMGFFGNDLAGVTPLVANVWTHLTFVYTGSQKQIYVNGILDASQNSGAYQSPLSNAQIGRYPWSYSWPKGSISTFFGLIDEVRVYNRALSLSDINGVYTTQTNVMISPRTPIVGLGQTQAFSAIVTGNAVTDVTWTLPTANTGTISTAGLYTPPATIPFHGITYTVKATSQAATTQTDSALVTVKYPVYVTPKTLTLPANGTATFAAEITGLASNQVTWKASSGSITSAGIFTAPATSGTVTITATSTADSTKTDTATVTVGKANVAADVLMAFDEGIGTTTQDSMGSGVVGTLVGSPVWTEGKSGKALNFSNSSAKVTLNPCVPLGGAWTISAWFLYPLPSTATWHDLTRGISSDTQIMVHSDQISLGTYQTGYGFRSSGFKLNTLSAGWHNVVAVGQSETTQFYVDGTIVGSAIPWQSHTEVFAIGNDTSASEAFGVLDEVRIFNRVLSLSEVRSIASGVKIAINQASLVVSPSATQTFTATVTGTTTTSVTWELPDSASGSITATGVYTAPARIPYDGVRYRVIARSTVDTAQTALAWVTVTSSGNPLPLIHLPFQEGTGTLTSDVSGHGHQGVLDTGLTWSSAGKIGNAIKFDAGKSVKVSSFSTPSNALTLSAWIYPTGVGTHGTHGGVIAGVEGKFLLTRFVTGSVNYALRNSSSSWVYVNTNYTAPLNQWTHLVLTYSSSDKLIKLYANNVLVYSVTGTGPISTSGSENDDLWIGNRSYTPTGFQGLIDEVRIFDRAITASEVGSLYSLSAVEVYPVDAGVRVGQSAAFQALVPGLSNQAVTWELPVASSGSITTDGIYTAPASVTGGDTTFPVLARSVSDTTRTGTAQIRVRGFANSDMALAGYWPFNESTGVTVLDQSRFANRGTLTDGLVKRVGGRSGNALSFDGANGRITIPDHPALNPSSLTLSFWLRLDRDPAVDTTSSWRSLLHKGSFYGGSSGYSINLETNRSIDFDTGNGTSDRWWPQGVKLPIGQWTHLVLAYDAVAGLKSAFQDGQLMDTKRVSALPLQPVASPLYVNNPSSMLPTGGYGNFPGVIDEFRVYNRALAATDVTALYAQFMTIKLQPQDLVLATGQTQSFKAMVGGNINQGVNWSVLDTGGGTIDSTGLYTAPATISSQGVRYRVQAQSQANTGVTNVVYVTVKKPVYVTPTTLGINAGASAAFKAEVTGLSGTRVTWSASAGTISSTGVFTAPATTGNVTITATSVVDATQSATATVTVYGATTVADAYFSFDEGTGSIAGDSSGHGYIGSLQNGPQWMDGRFGKGLKLSNVKSVVTLNPAVDLGDAWTISAWIQTPIPQTGTYHTLTRGVNADHQILIHTDQSTLGLWDTTSSSWQSTGFSLAALAAGWHHVAAVGLAGTTTFYVDGQLAGNPIPYQSKSDVYYLGGYPDGSQAFGAIDEVKIYRRALGPAEIANQFKASVNVTASPAAPTLILGQAQTFTATVTGTTDQVVTWSVQEPTGGTINATTGAYTAPASIPAEGTVYHVMAKSHADATKTASIAVTLRSPIVVTPAVSVVSQGATQSYTVATTNLSGTAVTWSVSAGGGTINATTGVYTAPATAGVYTITATSTVDATKKGTATVMVPLGISIVPSKAGLLTGSGLQLQAQVMGATNKAVTWSVWESLGGTVSSAGFYKAPLSPGVFHVSAVAQADPKAVAIAFVNVVRDSSYLVDPESVTVKPNAIVNFKVLGPDLGIAKIAWQASGGTITSNGVLTAPATAGTYTVLAYVTTDITRIVAANVKVAATAPVDSVTISPAEIDLSKKGTTTFTAAVSGGVTGKVTWSMVGTGSGSINASTGVYTAPDAFGTYTVKATSTEDSTAYATATVTVRAQAGTDKNFIYDLNGNLTSDGDRSFEWDAENRLISVTINATGHRSEFGYDGLGRRVAIKELDPDANKVLQTTSDKKYLWDGVEIAEERDSTGANVTKRFYSQGFVDSDGTNLYYTKDHLGSIRELTDSSQTVRARYDYDPYGRMTKISGDRDSAFTYTGHFWHAQSGLNLAIFRAYDPNLGRWISRDLIGEFGGLNNYGYVGNNVINDVDLLGLCYQTSGEVWQCKLKFLDELDKTVKQIDKLEDQLRDAYRRKVDWINNSVDEYEKKEPKGWDPNKGKGVNAVNAAFDGIDQYVYEKTRDYLLKKYYEEFVKALVTLQQMRQRAWDAYQEKIKQCKLCDQCGR